MEDIFRRKNWVKLNRPNRTTSNTKLLARVQPDIRNKILLPPWNKFHLPRYRYSGGLVPPRFFCEATTNFVDATDWKRTRGRRDKKEGGDGFPVSILRFLRQQKGREEKWNKSGSLEKRWPFSRKSIILLFGRASIPCGDCDRKISRR